MALCLFVSVSAAVRVDLLSLETKVWQLWATKMTGQANQVMAPNRHLQVRMADQTL